MKIIHTDRGKVKACNSSWYFEGYFICWVYNEHNEIMAFCQDKNGDPRFIQIYNFRFVEEW